MAAFRCLTHRARPVRASGNEAMRDFLDGAALWRGKSWGWFTRHAESRHALVWLALLAFADGIFLPIAPEIFLVALMLARPTHWKRYLPVAIASSVAGAAVGYVVAAFLFHQFGEAILNFYGLHHAFAEARHLVRGHVFFAMVLAAFTPLPDKVFIYAGGFLGAHFVPFITGYFVGRSIRMAVVTYLTQRYGRHILDLLREYAVVAAIALVVFVGGYFWFQL